MASPTKNDGYRKIRRVTAAEMINGTSISGGASFLSGFSFAGSFLKNAE